MSPSISSLHPILRAVEGADPGRAPKARGHGAAQSTNSFWAEGQLPLGALTVSAQGVGALTAPLSPTAAQALHAAARPARHGRRDKTLLDKRVRDTGELPSDQLTVHWAEGVFATLQAQVARAFGLQQLDARLHNLLVYRRGQFFKPHQDTEKHAGMVATLVLVWPCAHIGGGLVVRHGAEETQFASQHLQAEAIRWFAFYADCRHEVLPVTEGWRVVLTFDLVLPAGPATARAAVPPALMAAMREQFFPAGGAALRPWVFLLDHEYTEHGLHWPLLKGADRSRVAALRAGAEALGLRVHLALAEVHEQWAAQFSRRGGAPEPGELIERGVVLNHWVDAGDQVLRRDALNVSEADTASFSPTDESFLFDEEYEGYMGNYGETLQYWYRRAALVVQTPLAEEAGRFVSDFAGALADAHTLAREGRGDELAERLNAAQGVLRAQSMHRGRTLFAAYSKLAAALPDEKQAHQLMAGFDWTALQKSDAKTLARLSASRGVAWTAALIDAWAVPADAWRGPQWRLGSTAAGDDDFSDDDAEFDEFDAFEVDDADYVAVRDGPPWPHPLQPFVAAAIAGRVDAGLVDHLLQRCLQALVAADAALARLAPVSSAATLAARLQAVCDLAVSCRPTTLAGEWSRLLVAHVQAHPHVYPPLQLRSLVQAVQASAGTTAAAKALHKDVVAALRQALARRQRDAADQTLDDVDWVCRCIDCSAAIRWAESPQPQALTLAMPEARRRHVQESLSAAGARLTYATLRKGSPHKLVISKPVDLHARRGALRSAWQKDLAALGG